MSIIIPNGYANVAIHFQCTGRSREYIVTHGLNHFPTTLTADQLADACDAALAGPGGPISVPANMLAAYTYTGITLTLGTPTGPVPGVHAGVVAGTAAAGASPGNVAYLVRKHTGRGGKQGRGRMFVPPFNLAETSIDSAGFLSSGTAAALTTQWEAYRNNLFATGSGPAMVLLHGPTKAGGPIPAPDVVTSLSVELEVATQRRRIRR